MLHRGCARALAYLREQVLAVAPVIVQHPDLDEFMGLEAALDFDHDAAGEPGAADNHHRLERMSASPEGAAVSEIEQFHCAHCVSEGSGPVPYPLGFRALGPFLGLERFL